MKILQLVAILLLSEAFAVDFEIKNNGNSELWIGVQGNNGKPPLKNGGFKLAAHQSVTVNSAPDWAGRFWARTGCNGQTNHCDTGDCGNKLECGGNGGAPPATLVEITLKGDQGNDFYDVSLVDGYNTKASIEPVNGQGACKKSSCDADVNAECPNDLKDVVGGRTVGCKSACEVYHQDKYCCTGGMNKPETCPPTEKSKYFKGKCPAAYSYAYDDKSSTFVCKAEKYMITFG